MTPPRPTAALLRLRAALGVPEDAVPATRVLRHRGTCGDGAGVESVDLEPLGVPVVDAACDGACWAAPAATLVRPGHRHRFAHLDRARIEEMRACMRGECEERQAGSGESGLTGRLGRNDGSLADVLAQGGYAAAALAVMLPAARVVEVAAGAGLAVRDGRGILAAPEWAHAAAEGQQVLIVNVGGTRPGAVRDRHLLEGDPHRVVEGILVVCRATGVRDVHVRIAGEPRGLEALERALVDATAADILAGDAFGGDAVEVHLHAGGALIEPAGALVHDLETLCAATTIFDVPPPPTKLVALSGDLARPGLIEVPVDGNTTWAGLLAMAGVTPARVRALRVDGPAGRLVRPEAFDDLLRMPALGAGDVEVLGPGADLDEAERP